MSLFLLTLSKEKLKGISLGPGPELITFVLICSSSITCALVNFRSNFSCNYFSHVSKGFIVPEVRIIERGFFFWMPSNVSQGTRHLRPNVKESLLSLSEAREIWSLK